MVHENYSIRSRHSVTETSLHGFGVLVTRPETQAAKLVEAIQSKGGTAILFPAIEIVARDKAAVAAEAAALAKPDVVIFASRSAVEHGLSHTDGAAIAAIGNGTAAAIQALGETVDIEPGAGFDSESLLQHPALKDVRAKVVRIVRGGDGRELLAKTLRDRGATVTYLAVYDRERPAISLQDREKLEVIWRAGEIHAITVMSIETFTNLTALLPDWCRQQLERVPLVTPALRVIKEIQNLYPSATTILAAGPQAADMLDAIISIHQTEPGQAT
jgi:uroporphyrinogen-III synthase